MLRLVVLLAMLAVSSVHAQPQQNWAAWSTPSLVNLSSWVSSTAQPSNRGLHTASVLADGRVLLTGGFDGAFLATTLLGTISGDSVTWVASTNLPGTRRGHAASTLPDGRVLVAGGFNGTYFATTWLGTVSSNSVTWVTSNNMPGSNAGLASTVLTDGRVLLAGGAIYPATTWLGTVSGTATTWVTSTALPANRMGLTASTLSDGRVLIAGGSADAVNGQATTWLGTVSGTAISWVASTAMPAIRWGHTSSVLSDGRVLITGGSTNSTAAQSSAWLGTISSNTIAWVSGTALPAIRAAHTASVLPIGRVLLTGGTTNNSTYESASWLSQ